MQKLPEFKLIPAILKSTALEKVTAGSRLQINLVTDDIEAANGLKYELEDLALEKLHNVTVTNSLNCDILFFCNESKPLADDTRLTVKMQFLSGCFEISQFRNM